MVRDGQVGGDGGDGHSPPARDPTGIFTFRRDLRLTGISPLRSARADGGPAAGAARGGVPRAGVGGVPGGGGDGVQC
eukprot:8048526-Pyramimonas_sp.AAC.1